MLIDVRLTYTGEKKFAYSDLVNQEVMKLLPPNFLPENANVTFSNGYMPEYDVIVEEGAVLHRFEIKTTNKENGKVLIEECRADGQPSGLSATKSDYYVILHKTYNGEKQIGKLRIIKTDLLKEIVKFSKLQSSENVVINPPDDSGPGSQCVVVTFNKENADKWVKAGILKNSQEDGWLLDIDTTPQGYFNTEKIVRKNKSLY
jgi:hypothetical protein